MTVVEYSDEALKTLNVIMFIKTAALRFVLQKFAFCKNNNKKNLKGTYRFKEIFPQKKQNKQKGTQKGPTQMNKL